MKWEIQNRKLTKVYKRNLIFQNLIFTKKNMMKMLRNY